MNQNCRTELGKLRIRPRVMSCPEKTVGHGNRDDVIWKEAGKCSWGEKLMQNLVVASAVAICAVALRSGAVPSAASLTDAVMTAAQDDSLLDEQLGKLSFVSTLFPEAVLVFGQSSVELNMPVSDGAVVHAWSENEPYVSIRSTGADVLSAEAGEVIGVYHGNGDERLLQVMGEDGVSCMYGNLDEVLVDIGDYVDTGTVIGRLMEDAELVFEVRRDGVSMDPAMFVDGL